MCRPRLRCVPHCQGHVLSAEITASPYHLVGGQDTTGIEQPNTRTAMMMRPALSPADCEPRRRYCLAHLVMSPCPPVPCPPSASPCTRAPFSPTPMLPATRAASSAAPASCLCCLARGSDWDRVSDRFFQIVFVVLRPAGAGLDARLCPRHHLPRGHTGGCHRHRCVQLPQSMYTPLENNGL